MHPKTNSPTPMKPRTATKTKPRAPRLWPVWLMNVVLLLLLMIAAAGYRLTIDDTGHPTNKETLVPDSTKDHKPEALKRTGNMTIIEPQLNRAVLFKPPSGMEKLATDEGMCSAVIIGVVNARRVHLVWFSQHGSPTGERNVKLYQPDELNLLNENTRRYCVWPPHLHRPKEEPSDKSISMHLEDCRRVIADMHHTAEIRNDALDQRLRDLEERVDGALNVLSQTSDEKPKPIEEPMAVPSEPPVAPTREVPPKQ